MRVHVLDDWFDTLRELPCYARLKGHEVTVWTDHIDDIDTLAARLHDAETLVLFRERTNVTRALLDRLPNLRLISQRGVFPHVDVPACTDHGVMLCSKMPAGAPNHAAVELAWALIMAGMRDLPRQMASVKAGAWQAGVGKTLHGATARAFWLREDCETGRRIRPRFRDGRDLVVIARRTRAGFCGWRSGG